jgi:hypothetical protein
VDKKFICQVSLFAEEQSILFVKNDELIESFSYALKDLKKAIVALCYEKDVYDVSLLGPTTYNQHIAEDIEREEKLKYSENKIKVEVR